MLLQYGFFHPKLQKPPGSIQPPPTQCDDVLFAVGKAYPVRNTPLSKALVDVCAYSRAVVVNPHLAHLLS